MPYQYLFGPIPSRRLGISLGVDLVPAKVCSFNCCYCEAGGTTNLTRERREYLPAAAIINELDDFLASQPELDYITFSGAGEPTLNSSIGLIISHLKEHYPAYRIALITNSSLFSDPQLRAEVATIDLLLPSLDTVSETVFQRLNRPAPGLKIQAILQGLVTFRRESSATMWLEIFISPGLNDSESELAGLKKACLAIKPDRLQLNSLDRPGTEPGLQAMTPAAMERIAEYLAPLPTEIIARFSGRATTATSNPNNEGMILETIRRRPCTAEDLATSLGLPLDRLQKSLDQLTERGMIKERRAARGLFYQSAGENRALKE